MARSGAGRWRNLRRPGATLARLWTLAVRFVLVFFLARFLSPEDVGLYGLLVATIGFTIYLLGIDLYTFTSRELLKSSREDWRRQALSHFALLLPVGLVGLCASFLFFGFGALPWSLALWFLILAPTEHLGFEIDRMLIAMSDQLSASLLVLLRQGLLPTAVIPIFLFIPDSRSIDVVLSLWLALNVISVAVGFLLLTVKTRGGTDVRVDWQWAIVGVKVALPFLAGTLAVKALFTVDRQVVLIFGSLTEVGVYTFAMSVAAGLTSVLAVAVHQFSYPRLITAAHEGAEVTFNRLLRNLWWQSVVLVVLAVASVLMLGPFLLQWVGNPIYAEDGWLLPVAMVVVGIYNLSLVPHYVLYAVHADRTIVWITVISVVIFGVSTAIFLLCGASSLLSAALGVGCASIVLLVCKGTAARRRRTAHFS